VKSVTLYDPNPIEIADLSSQYFFRESDVGKPRDEISLPHLGELNTYTPVSVLHSSVFRDVELLSRYKAVVTTETSLSTQLKVNEYCHKNKIPYVSAEVRGLFGNIFCDFGDGFVVIDSTGESSVSGIVAGIDSSGLVTALDETRHGLEDGDHVTFSEIQGMESLNGAEFKVEVKGKT
jgi:ubiquitin-activating enzyme E1